LQAFFGYKNRIVSAVTRWYPPTPIANESEDKPPPMKSPEAMALLLTFSGANAPEHTISRLMHPRKTLAFIDGQCYNKLGEEKALPKFI